MYNQRDIVLIPFPYSDLTGSKQRPALIISNSLLNKTQDRICCLVTTNSHENDVLIEKNSFDEWKLPFKSWIRSHRIFTIDTRIVKRKLCRINNKLHDKVIASVNKYLKRD